MSDEQKAREDEVFDQELSADDLDAAAGGNWVDGGPKDDDWQNCVNHDYRQIYGGKGFPNCAATVEDGSHCESNDACFIQAVQYRGIKSTVDCNKAWE